MVNQVRDPAVRAFWLREFTSYDRRLLAEMLAPVQNKVGQLLMAAPLRDVLAEALPQHVVLGVQELDLPGQLVVHAAGEEDQQGWEESGHARKMTAHAVAHQIDLGF